MSSNELGLIEADLRCFFLAIFAGASLSSNELGLIEADLGYERAGMRWILITLLPEAFQECFPAWLAACVQKVRMVHLALLESMARRVVALTITAVWENQPKMLDEIEKLVVGQLEGVREDLEARALEISEKGHRRIDERSYGFIKLPRDCALKKAWSTKKTIAYAVRITQGKVGMEKVETRYFILNCMLLVSTFASAVRKHWSIEARHWTLDKTFGEDAQQASERTLVNNLSWLRRFATSMLKRGQQKGEAIVGRIEIAAYNTDILEQVLCGQ